MTSDARLSPGAKPRILCHTGTYPRNGAYIYFSSSLCIVFDPGILHVSRLILKRHIPWAVFASSHLLLFLLTFVALPAVWNGVVKSSRINGLALSAPVKILSIATSSESPLCLHFPHVALDRFSGSAATHREGHYAPGPRAGNLHQSKLRNAHLEH